MSLSAAAPQTNATVFASAGSGKTWLLVTRVIRLLLDGARPDAILAVTFTRKAAGEMQARLNERLRSWLELDDPALTRALKLHGVEPDPDILRRAKGLYERLLFSERPVRTTTFHALCQDILRRFPLEAEVPPGFELLEATSELRNQAWEALFSEATQNPDALVAHALQVLFETCNGLDNTRTALDSFLEHRSDWWAYTEGQDEPLAHAADRLQERLDFDPDTDPVADFFRPATIEALQAFRDLLSRHKTKGNEQHAEALAKRLADRRWDQEAFLDIRAVFLTERNEPRKRKPSQAQAKSMTAAGEESFLALHERLSARVLEVLDALARRHTHRMTQAWYEAGERYLGHYQRLKEELRALDFTDLEWRAYRLLNQGDNALWVQYKLDQRIDHLLIDEFQDTNPTQWRLLLPLLEELAAGKSERSRSVFLVGDTKQSIYGFRRAQPELQHAAAHWLQRHLAGRDHHLDKSWRSAPAIVSFVNQVFGTGPLAERLDDFQPHDTHRADLWGRVELLALIEPHEQPSGEDEPPLRNPLEQPRCVHEDDTHLREGRAIAARIQQLVSEGTPVGDAESARPIEFGDVIILVRSRTHTQALERALREAGVPYFGAEQGTLLDSLEIQDMVALLETLMTPFNDLALAQVLRSPLFAATDEDLVTLAATSGRAWMERLAQLAAQDQLSARLQRAHDRLNQWRSLAGRVPIHDLLDRIYTEGNVLERYAAATREDQRPAVAANLIRFLELALEVDSGRYPSLVHFLARLQSLRAGSEEAPDAPPAHGGASRVRIMTIHAAKGLEAPVVFLADAAAGSNASHAYQALVDWPADAAHPEQMLLVGRRADLDTTTAQALDKVAAAEAREQANLLYVALTRAQQLLVVSGCHPARGNALGWYGEIRDQLEGFGNETQGGGWMYEHGSQPKVRVEAGAVPMEREQITPELGRPLKAPHWELEVAPSHAVTTGGRTTQEDEDALQRGIAIHRLLELLSGTRSQERTGVLNQVAGELGLDSHHTELRHWWEEANAVLAAEDVRWLFDSADYERAMNEVPVVYENQGRRVHGIIDRLLLHADAVTLVDYKTHRVTTDTDIAALTGHYREQMKLYHRGVQKLWPDRSVRCFLLFTHSRRLVPVPLEQS